jgi:hypothetical protein
VNGRKIRRGYAAVIHKWLVEVVFVDVAQVSWIGVIVVGWI